MMPINHTIRAGDCVSSVALEHGFFPDTIWTHEGNAGLRSKREDPCQLVPGDVLAVPDLTPKEEIQASTMRHRYRRRGVPAYLTIQLRREGKPRAKVSYRFDIDGQLHSGQTDENGVIRLFLRPDAGSGMLYVGQPPNEEKYEIEFGSLEPISTNKGVQARLKALGYYSGEVDGALNEKTVAALCAFQGAAGLEPTGKLDDATREALESLHDHP